MRDRATRFTFSIVLIFRSLRHPLDLCHLPEQMAELAAIEFRHCGDTVNVLNQVGFGPEEQIEANLAFRLC